MGMHQPVDMFDPQRIIQELFNLNKTYWLNSMEMMSVFQDQTMSVFNTLLEQGLVNQRESKKVLQDWLSRTKQAQEQYADEMKNSWEKTEAMFTTNPKAGK